MLAPHRVPACLGCLAILLAAPVAPAAEWQRSYLEPAIQAWMGMVTMLAEDGDREDTPGDREDSDRRPGRMHDRGHRHHAEMGPPRPEGPRADAISMLHEISGRLARIERMLAARGPGGPPAAGPGRGEGRGSRRPEMSSEAREMMEARMAKMKEARQKWENASPEEREAMKKQWEARMQEGRARMERARVEGREKMERAREEGRERLDAARARLQSMEARLEQLEAEVARLKQAAENDD